MMLAWEGLSYLPTPNRTFLFKCARWSISRPPIPRGVQGRIADLYRQGVSMHQISKKLGIGYSTAWNYVQRVKAGRLRSDGGNLSL
jgi:hypothetical protein